MKIGILGGGQLGRMLIQQALKYDDTWEVLDPSANAPCANIARHTLGSFADYNAVLEFGRKVDVLSIEIEHVNAQALAELEKEGIKVIPNAKAISMIQSKIMQKAFYVQHGIPTASYQAIQTVSQHLLCKKPVLGVTMERVCRLFAVKKKCINYGTCPVL